METNASQFIYYYLGTVSWQYTETSPCTIIKHAIYYGVNKLHSLKPIINVGAVEKLYETLNN